MQDTAGNYNNIITLEFADSKIPEFKKRRGENYVMFGDDDKYPEYLIHLLDKSPKHGAIIANKVVYIIGGGLKAEKEDLSSEWFISQYSDLTKRVGTDLEAFSNSYVQAIPTRDGKSYYYHHLSFDRIRTNKENSLYYYKEDWTDRAEQPKTFPAFAKGLRVPSIIHFREYRPGKKQPYSLPRFISAANYIEADIEVSRHTLTNAQTGFSASKFINFYNGEPNEATKRSLEERFTNKYGGSQGKKIIIAFNNDPNKKPTVDDLGASDLTKEDFTAVDDMIKTNIYAGHQITNPALFGVPNSNHSLGGNSGAELRMSYEIFNKTYAASKRQQLEKMVNFLAANVGVTSKLSFVEIEPVGIEFSEGTLLKVAPESWIVEKLGIDKTKYTDAPIEAPVKAAPVNAPVQTAEQMVNENLKNLTAKQHQQLERIIRQYKKGKLERATAELLLKSGLGLSTEDIAVVLGKEQFSSDEDAFAADEDVAMLFEAFGEAADNYKCFEKRLISSENFKDEQYSDVEDKIRLLVEKDPKAKPEDIAKLLNIDVEVVKNYLEGISGGSVGNDKPKLPKFEVRYSYEKRKDVEGPSVLPTTRPFCKKMVALNRLYTRKEIQQISAFLGYDVMLRAGGFWNNNGTIEYHCRHEFFSQIVIKKK